MLSDNEVVAVFVHNVVVGVELVFSEIIFGRQRVAGCGRGGVPA